MKEALFKWLFPKQHKEMKRLARELETTSTLYKNAKQDIRELVKHPHSLDSLRVKTGVLFEDDLENALWFGARKEDEAPSRFLNGLHPHGFKFKMPNTFKGFENPGV